MSNQPAARKPYKMGDVLFQIEKEQNTQIIPDWLNNLKPYLSPDLWRKLVEDDTRRGLLNNALDRMQSLHYVISTYLPSDLVREKMKDQKAERGGKIIKGCLLFSDVSGFTALSERLAVLGPKGAEHLTEVINRYFTEMIDILSRSNGTLLKFAGDATLVYFPEQSTGEHILWAARAGRRMMRAMQKFTDLPTPLGPVTITMKIGLSAGAFLAASVGSEERMEYALIGNTVSQTLQAEGCTKPGDIVANHAAAEALSAVYEMSEVKPGFFLLKPGSEEKLDEYEITRTERRKTRGSAAQWDATEEEIKTSLAEKVNQIKALTPYLASELVERIITHADQRQVQSEYRPTAVMFCNFTGPEALLELWGDSGAQRVTRILSEYFSAINEAISRFGGIVSRIDPYSQGTKLLALFGAPIAHEDDAQRAASAALEMNNALSELNRNWAENFSHHLPPGSKKIFIEHRIGITLGDTFAGQAGAPTRREYTVMGDEVNLAARLMSAARAGQILISQPVHEAAGDYYVTRKLPSVRVKGKKNLIEIWQVDGARENTLLNRIHTRLPLVGRATELENGWKVFRRAHGSKCSLLAISGQAGIGKSHLADALLQKALKDDWQVQAHQCRSYGKAFSVWKALLRSMAGITSIDHPLIQKEKLERFVAQLRLPAQHAAPLTEMMNLQEARSANDFTDESGKWNAEELFENAKVKKIRRKGKNSSALNKLLGIMDGDQKLETQTSGAWRAALAAVLTALSAQKPLVIFFEDAHWMDSESKACLEEFNRKLPSQPLLFLLALRGDSQRTGETIELDPFTKNETQAMVAEILTAGLADIIHEQSNGSPLFVGEITRWLKREYNIDETRLKEILQTSDVLQSLVLSRLENLPEGQREVARLASVIGMEFTTSEIKALTELDSPTLHQYLTALETDGLILMVKSMVLEKQYAFAQPIFRDVLYTSLPFERRSELHKLMAQRLAKKRTANLKKDKIFSVLESVEAEANPTKLAYHYEMSEQWLDAAKQLLDAAESQPQAARENFYAKALTLLERCPPEKADAAIGMEKIRVHLALGESALKRLDFAAAAAAHEAALAALPESAAPETKAKLTAHLCLLLPSQGKTEAAEKHLAAALNDQPENWKLHAVFAWLKWRAGQNAAPQIEACRAALPATDSSEKLRAQALMDDLAGDWEAALKTYQLLNEINLTALAWVQWGDKLLKEKNPAQAAERYEQAAAAWQDANDCGLALTRYRKAEAELQARRKAKALSLLKEALALLEKSAAALQTEPRSSIQKAMTRINDRNYSDWNYWRWQPFDDLARIEHCFALFQEAK